MPLCRGIGFIEAAARLLIEGINYPPKWSPSLAGGAFLGIARRRSNG